MTLITSPIDEVISNEKLSDVGMENMQVAKRNADRMLRLINQILDFRKIQNDKMKVLVEQVDVIPLILKIYGNFVPMAHTHRIDFRLICPLDTFVMYTDVDKLERFFLIYCPMPLNILPMRKVSSCLLLVRNRFYVCK